LTNCGIADASALAAQSPEDARAKLAEHLSDVIALATAAARGSVRLQEELREQGAPEGEFEEFQLGIDRIMTSGGNMLTTVMELELGDAPGLRHRACGS
jgi:hypothetical protein